MTHDDIDLACEEARRFLERADAARAAIKREMSDHGGYWWNTDTRATAALKRASMDLTRALVAIRRSA